MKKERGYAFLIDGHSMTAVGLKNAPDYNQQRDDFVVGTLHGKSADPKIIAAFTQALKQEAQKSGFSVKKDIPYAGAFITRKYHNPRQGVHVLQLEVNMGTYLYEDTENARRYSLKHPEVKIVQSLIEPAIKSACEAAEKL